MAGVKWEKRGFMVGPPKRGKGRGGWAPFTIIWGGKQNSALKGGK